MNLCKNLCFTLYSQVHKQYPKNINTLANLIYMCQNTKPRRDVTKYQEKLRNLQGNQVEESRRLLEQGYVLLTDTHSEAKENANKKVKDIRDILQQREHSTTGIRANQIRKTYEFVDQLEQHLKALPDICVEDTKKQRQWSIECFKTGLKGLEKQQSDVYKTEILVWKHCLGKAYNRVGGSCLAFSKTSEKKADLRISMTLFCEVIKGLPENTLKTLEPNMTICVARSYAYLGHMIMTKKKIIAGVKEPIPECMTHGGFEEIWANPIKALEKAQLLGDKDRVVLNRYGLTLQKDEKYDLALMRYNISINVCREYNWFAYSCRGDLYLTKYLSEYRKYEKEKEKQKHNRISMTDPKPPDKSLLVKAEEDLEKCLTYKTTNQLLLNLAYANYYQGTDPDKVKSMKDPVIDSTKVQKAILKLQESLEHHECGFHSKVYSLLGKCLFCLGDRNGGIEYMKTAINMEPPNVQDPVDFRDLCMFVLKTYQIEKNEPYSRRIYLLTELWVILQEAARKYKKRMKYQLIGVANLFPHEVLDLLQEVQRGKIRYNSKDSKTVIDICMGTLMKHNGKRVKMRAGGLTVQELSPSECDEEPDVLSTEPAPEQPMFKKKYDFYISCSNEILPWVKICLLQTLEKQYNLKGCIRTRDFDPSKSAEESLASVLPETRKVVIVFSECYNRNYLKECYTIVRYTNPDGERKTAEENSFIIPILRDVKHLPECLNYIEPLEFSTPPYDFQKLWCALCEEYACPMSQSVDSTQMQISDSDSDTESTDSYFTAIGEQQQDWSWSSNMSLDEDS